MPKTAKSKPKPTTTRTRSLPAPVPQTMIMPRPPPRPPVVKEKSRRNGLSARAKAEIQTLKEALDKKETKAAHVVAGGAGAIGCTLGGAFIVGKGWLGPKWASLLLTTVGAGATFAGWYYDQPTVMWGGAGCAFAGAAHTTMAVVVDTRRKASEQPQDGQAQSQPRNAAPAAESDIGQRLRLSQDRARELEAELARARQRLNPEIELAAA